ncbi:uncharacterized protein ARMOST_04927 [Armillaria ostoyae]|uniref:Uncharacterized protein n=1 Tax=Armillaria ostoyae TaxID=47428 RepID=A0A284QYQ7_ARMOS|nr:uncharacterized protein ARMOST_04927 [Armillaria ostoyae]
MTTDVPSRLVCPITKCHNADIPLDGHLFVADDISPAVKMHLEWAWGFNPHEMVLQTIDNCIAYRPDILQNAVNGDFALVPTITTLNKMLRYFKLPYDTNVVYRTRTLGAKFIKHRRILFTEYMPETVFRYLFVPLTPAGETIHDQYVKEEQASADYEGAIDPLSPLTGAPLNPEALMQIRQFRVVISHVHPFFAATAAYGFLFPTRTRPGHWFLSVACNLFSQLSASGVDPPAWFRRRYKDIEFETYYDDDDEIDANTSDEEELLEEEKVIVNNPEADDSGENLRGARD